MTFEQCKLSIWLWFLLMWGDYTHFRWLCITLVLAINLSRSIELSFEHRLNFNICSEIRRQEGVMIKVNKMTNYMNKLSKALFLNSWHSIKKDPNIYEKSFMSM